MTLNVGIIHELSLHLGCVSPVCIKKSKVTNDEELLTKENTLEHESFQSPASFCY